MSATTVEYAEFQPATTEAAFTTEADSDSGWELTDQSTNHNIYFEHGLGAIPSQITVYFSADKQTVYPLNWSWTEGTSGNPVSIAVNDKTVVLSIYKGAPLHGVWDGRTGEWEFYDQGYFRVFASR